jgi:hypothetical protein
MAIGVRILSDNLSGKTTNVTFEPVTGGTFNLGTKTVPFNNIDSYPYGIYNLYFAEYDYTYSLLVPDPTPLELVLDVEYFPGSIIAIYTLISNLPVSGPVTAYVENILEVFTGSPINITTGVTISYGNISGQTIVTVDGSYDNTTGVYLFGPLILSGAPSGSTGEIFVINPKPTPTPTPTPTETPTPTPTPTETPTPTPEETLVDPIITDQDNYISVGENFYLQYID